MNGNETERGLGSDYRIILLVAVLLLSLILLFLPIIFPGLNVGGLNYGLDLEGGSWLELRPEGAITQLDADTGLIIEQDYGVFFNDTITITQQTESAITFTIAKPVTSKQIESLGYGQASVSTSGGVTTVELRIEEPKVISGYLENWYQTDVIFFEDDDVTLYEIRKKTSQ
ncbi:MAG: hypothetical protein KAJ93_08610, partial [Methanosarcinales archaeon]|nr:hypothetical protein [Methanosarcinales archaeon]